MREAFDRLLSTLRREAVLAIAFVCACASLPFAGDPMRIPSYIDWRVIVLLLCLMASVAGVRESGALDRAARGLVAGDRSRRFVFLALVMTPFFASMLVTNDVALITFVPFAIASLEAAGWREATARVVVLQAIAANLGGMVTPFGNPQNLFIFTKYEIGVADFFWTLAPFAILAFVLLAAACIALGGASGRTGRARLGGAGFEQGAQVPCGMLVDGKGDGCAPVDMRRFALHAALFALSVCAVVRLIPWYVLPAVVLPALLLFDRRIFGQVDWALLATFVCFFVFSGDASHMPLAQEVLGSLMRDHPMLTSLGASQVISNVPAAVLLAEFTANWHSLLIGVNLGGLGTPIASLASLIAYRLYKTSKGASTRTFMVEFGLANAIVLMFMVVLYAVLFVL